jgi:CBS domain-containing protein
MGESNRSLGKIKISEFMIRDPYFTVPDEKIITQRDIRLARFATNLDSPNTRVKDLMTSETITLQQEDTFEHALEKMMTKHIERLPVVNPNKKLIGLITKQSILERLFKFLKDTNT